MTRHIALLRAVNVGGTGQLPMSELRAMCLEAGFTHVETYIASGNVVFQTKDSAAKVKSALEARLLAYAGKPVGVLVRTAAEMKAVLEVNPFQDHPANRTVAICSTQSRRRMRWITLSARQTRRCVWARGKFTSATALTWGAQS